MLPMSFPENFLDLLDPASRALLYLATIMPDGSPQVAPVWFDTDAEYILINTNEGRVKDKNMKARKNVAMVIQDPHDPYRYLGIRGVVVDYTREGADEHIAMLAMRYDNKPWKRRENQRRIIFKIKPTSFDQHN
jgi:PPOX class probable F420-dependent enzyme